MSLNGQFNQITSNRLPGVRMYSFTLTNSEWFGSEKFDCMLCDAAGQQPWFYREQNLKAGATMRFDFDTVGWTWCQGDFFAILGRKDKIEKSWQLRLKEYRPGECPECHGTHKCDHCNGQGYSFSFNGGVSQCPHCGGTGICQTCYIPQRRPKVVSSGPSGVYQQQGGGRKGRSVAQIQMEIGDLQRKINQVDWDLRRMQMNGSDVSSHRVYMSFVNLKYQYEKQLLKLQQELRNAL